MAELMGNMQRRFKLDDEKLLVNGWIIERIGGCMDFCTFSAKKGCEYFEFTTKFGAVEFSRANQ